VRVPGCYDLSIRLRGTSNCGCSIAVRTCLAVEFVELVVVLNRLINKFVQGINSASAAHQLGLNTKLKSLSVHRHKSVVVPFRKHCMLLERRGIVGCQSSLLQVLDSSFSFSSFVG
jgi:hypothetical protein